MNVELFSSASDGPQLGLFRRIKAETEWEWRAEPDKSDMSWKS